MANWIFKFTADTIDGKIQDHPKQFQLHCDLVKPIGIQVVRDYNGSECIQAMKVFLIMYGGQLLGNKCYGSFESFFQELKSVCYGIGAIQVNDCYLKVNGCNLTLN